MATERDPLIPRTESPVVGQAPGHEVLKRLTKVGPMEISRTTRYGILAGIWVGTFLSLRVLPSISSDFNKAHQASWLGTAYLLATCTFTPLYGRLSNVLGRRGANLVAVFFAGLGTVACGLSTNMESLIAARFMGMGLGGPLGGFISDRLGWRWAFLIQIPVFVVAFALISYYLNYVTPGRSKNTKEVLKRIDYGGSATLLVTVFSVLVFLSMRFSEEHPWSSPTVYGSLTSAVVFALLFLVVELKIAPEPILAPFLLREKIPLLVGVSNFLVATCNFTIMYNFPTWFQTVLLTSASEAGAHLIPNGVSISLGSLFAGWVMHRTGTYRRLNLIFGLFPFVAAILLSMMREDSHPVTLWLSIIPAGFGNAVVLQTMLTLPRVGQVGGVAVSSALFQSILTKELRKRIHGDGAEEMISKIRHSSTLVAQLPPDLQRAARDSYAISLRAVFIMAAVSTLLAYIVRLPIPDQPLDQPRPRARSVGELPNPHPDAAQLAEETGEERARVSPEDPSASTTEVEEEDDEDEYVPPIRGAQRPTRRRLSTYESSDGWMDLEDDRIGGSARR
ncbi:major facilitator superfamily domain-containing protein [Daedaleopsis nitida]|nr:major facilitator superfamily domain-containing protein [Daedaleopsis nitida]